MIKITTEAIAAMVGGAIEGDSKAVVTHPARIEEATEGALCFVADEKYAKYAYETKATALLVSLDFVPQRPIAATLIRVADVRKSVTLLLEAFAQQQASAAAVAEHPIDERAFVHATAKIAEGVMVGAFCYIGKDAVVEAGAVLHPQVYIGEGVKIGAKTELHTGVKILKGCVVGSEVVVHANAVIGSDGFGFAPNEDGTYRKIPQIGNVVIGNRVEIGSNTVIDRAVMGSTVVKDGVKLDNLIQIAHNVEIGENTVIAAQAGVAGSTKIGKNCMIGGQAGIVGHIFIADGTKIQAQSGVASSLKTPNKAWYGSPAFDYGQFLRSQAVFKRLPELERRLRELERQLKEAKPPRQED